ncbi:glutamate receptor 2.9-like protein [Tanacetum coccineum]
MKENRVFILLQSSLRSCILLFKRVKQLGMMENGYVWITSDNIASLLDSIDQSLISSMQGVIRLKTNHGASSDTFKEFKLKFYKNFQSKYPNEVEFTNPSIHALSTYDATWAVVKAMEVSKGLSLSEEFLKRVSHSIFNGLSRKIRFKDGKLANLPTYHIINMIGGSYKDIGYWSENSGFSSDTFGRGKADHGLICWPRRTHKILTGQALRNQWIPLKIRVPTKDLFNQIFKLSYDPGDNETYVTGFLTKVYDVVRKKLPYRRSKTHRFLTANVMEDKHKPLKVGVPTEAFFNQFVNVAYDSDKNKTYVTGWLIELFEALVKELPYPLSYILVPYRGTYDDLSS